MCGGSTSVEMMMSSAIVTTSLKLPNSYQDQHSCILLPGCALLKMERRFLFASKSPSMEVKNGLKGSFIGGLKHIPQSKVARVGIGGKGYISASLCSSAQIASIAFTWGTVAVLPFYTLMVLAPKAELTMKAAGSNVPYVLLGLLYAYLLYLSWTPETLRLMFASKYWLPELPGITRMFSNQVTVSSAWIHLLAVDLFAARQVFQDGLKNDIETRHSISFCLLFCPIGILVHEVTKMITKRTRVH